MINSWAISPDGKRVVFGARGDVYTLPAKSGVTRNLTESSGVHDRNVEWSPKGKYVSYISDRTGEDEIYIQNQDGKEDAIQITSESDTYKYNPIWSPDGKYLIWGDKMGRLNLVDINSNEVKQVDESESWEIRDYCWSPDSRWIAYTIPMSFTNNRIFIYSIESEETKPVTDTWYSASQPSFDDKGKYLFFSSSRDFNPIYSRTEWNHAYRDMDKIYFVTLNKNTPSPFEPQNDEVKVQTDETADSDSKDKKKDNSSKSETEFRVDIDFDGIIGRIISLPIKAANYWNITAIGDDVYFNQWKSGGKGANLMMYNLKKQKETNLGSIGSYAISADHKKMLVNVKGKYAVISLPKSKVKPTDYVDLSKKRLKEFNITGQKLIVGNALKKIKTVGKIDYCVTSPPYHNILRKKGDGVRHDGSQSRQGVDYYSEKKNDLGNQKSYDDYLHFLKEMMKEVYDRLRDAKYCSIVISDFTIDKKETDVSGDIIKLMQEINFIFKGKIILNQNQKSIYPFGYPYDYVINHTNQFILNFKKPKKD